MAPWPLCRDFCLFIFCNYVFLYFVFIVFDPHSAACRGGGGGGGDRWHHGRCAGNAKTARNHPRCSHHQLHNIGHVDLASREVPREAAEPAGGARLDGGA